VSRVTNVMVSVGVIEDVYSDAVKRLVTPGGYADGDQALDDISVAGSHHWGGYKVPTCSVYGAAFKGFVWDKFAAHVASCGWKYPDEVQVFVVDEDDDVWSVWYLDGGRLVCVYGGRRNA
jgi:hypothetical protein